MKITGYILSGGQSRRFGSDKARALLDGVSLIVRVTETIRSSCDEVIIVADVAEKYSDFGLRTITDLRPGWGPVTGLETALSHRLEAHGPGWILLVSCDLAGVGSNAVQHVINRLPDDAATRTVRAVAFHAEKWQPFPACFHTDLLPLCSSLLDEGKASFQRLLSDPRSHAQPLPLPPDWPATPQVNTREELERLSNDSRIVEI